MTKVQITAIQINGNFIFPPWLQLSRDIVQIIILKQGFGFQPFGLALLIRTIFNLGMNLLQLILQIPLLVLRFLQSFLNRSQNHSFSSLGTEIEISFQSLQQGFRMSQLDSSGHTAVPRSINPSNTFVKFWTWLRIPFIFKQMTCAVVFGICQIIMSVPMYSSKYI